MKKLISPHIFLTASIALAFFFPMGNLAVAKVVSFEKEYTYQASEFDSKASSRTIALAQIKRMLLEQLGTYIESQTEVKNFQITKDTITSLTAGFVRAEILDEKWDGKNFYLKAKVLADDEEVVKSIRKIREEKFRDEELWKTRRQAEAALKEIERLNRELKIDPKNAKNQKSLYANFLSELTIIDLIEQARIYISSEDYSEAIKALTNAIELYPRSAVCFRTRALTYMTLGNKEYALKDINKAIEIQPYNGLNYSIRGALYGHLGKAEERLDDYIVAAKLNDLVALKFISDELFARGQLLGQSLENVMSKRHDALEIQKKPEPTDSGIRELLRPLVKVINLNIEGNNILLQGALPGLAKIGLIIQKFQGINNTYLDNAFIDKLKEAEQSSLHSIECYQKSYDAIKDIDYRIGAIKDQYRSSPPSWDSSNRTRDSLLKLDFDPIYNKLGEGNRSFSSAIDSLMYAYGMTSAAIKVLFQKWTKSQ